MQHKDLCGVILNGGGSTRMGTAKSSLTFGSMTSLELIASTLSKVTETIIVNQNEQKNVSYPVVEDIYEDAGPLAGLHAVMRVKPATWFVMSACDTPFVSEEVYHRLVQEADESVDAVIPVYEGRFQPISGIYHIRILDKLDFYLSQGGRKVRGLFEHIKIKELSTYPDIDQEKLSMHFFNMNTPEEYALARDLFKKWSR
ncbi:NTP transferase domain-containing protein [Halobacillus litoralis]|uniref:Probable molybdenum cofactor guanylyltransferase n=1 Tax=Halobacillus litoralis TaxID=45668 RepID=A0A845E2V2_9BACI|nr:molybdenum cofactor guanylyltransferase [Halobacillus litoralis]MYL48526.1 NTP transferase domain-containing protein [Halobacillus litoralis]